jgi:hypothetical protein
MCQNVVCCAGGDTTVRQGHGVSSSWAALSAALPCPALHLISKCRCPDGVSSAKNASTSSAALGLRRGSAFQQATAMLLRAEHRSAPLD